MNDISICNGDKGKCKRKYECRRFYLFQRSSKSTFSNIVSNISPCQCLSVNLKGGEENEKEYSLFLEMKEENTEYIS